MPQFRGQQAHEPAARPGGAPLLGLLRVSCITGSVPGGTNGDRAGTGCAAASRWPGTSAAYRTGRPSAPATAAGPHRRLPWGTAASRMIHAGTAGGISAGSGGPLRPGPTLQRTDRPPRHGATGLWRNGRWGSPWNRGRESRPLTVPERDRQQLQPGDLAGSRPARMGAGLPRWRMPTGAPRHAEPPIAPGCPENRKNWPVSGRGSARESPPVGPRA